MPFIRIVFAALVSLCAQIASAAAGWESMVGTWQTETGGQVRVSRSGNELTVVFVKLSSANFQFKPGDLAIGHARPTGPNTVRSNNAVSYPKVGHSLRPDDRGTAELHISADGNSITGKRTLARYYDGSTEWDAGQVTVDIRWKRIGEGPTPNQKPGDAAALAGKPGVAAPVPCGGGGKLALIAGAVLLGAPPVPGAVASPTAPGPPSVYPPPLTKGPNPLPHDLNHPNNNLPTVSGKQYVDWLKSIEALNPGKSRGQIIAAIHARSHQGLDLNRSLPGTDMKLFAHGPESDGWKDVTFPTRNVPAKVMGAQGEVIDISHTIAGLRADLNRPEKVIAIGCAQFMRWANTDGGDSWQVMVQGMDLAPPDQRAGNALGIKASDFYRDPTARNIPLSKFFEAEFPK